MKTRNLSALFVMLLIASGLSGCKQVKRMFRNTTKEAQAFNNKLVAANKTINLAAQAFGRHLKPVLEGKKADSAALDKKFTEMKAAFDRVDQEMKGLKVPDLDGAKKLYDITDEGRAFLEANRGPLDALLARLSGATGERRAMPRIMRAMANVKIALRMRLANGSLSEAEADAIAAILDEAANKLERA